jgi:ribonuclease HII
MPGLFMTLTCGIDEAGRGPIIGPMVMAGVLVDEIGAQKLKKLGAKDSKLLSPKQREELFPKIKEIVKDFKIAIISPEKIDEAVQSTEGMNLNWLEAKNSALIINHLKPERIVIDCPSTNISDYKNYLLRLLDNKKVDAVVEHKADLHHVECSAASILAKVTRDNEIERLKKGVVEDFGSGYLTDPKTLEFFEKFHNVYPDLFRKSWAPYRKKMEGKNQKNLFDFD